MSDTYRVYIGTYTSGASEGIYVYSLDTTTGELRPSSVTSGITDPSFLAVHPTEKYLYAVAELGEGGGAVNAYSIDSVTGELSFLNQQQTKSAGPCHLSIDRTGQVVVTANYSGGSVTALPVEANGRLGEPGRLVRHEGSSGVNPERQEAPHPHSVNIDPTGRYVLVPDLGIDKIAVYKLAAESGTLTRADKPAADLAPGAGPRHLDFHPNGRWAYVINELGSTITGFGYDGAIGALREIQSVSTLPEDFGGDNYCADIHVSPDGRFVYGSNRGHDSIAAFAVDHGTGALSHVDHEPTGGMWPRNFAIDPTGSLLMAANEKSNSVFTFWIDRDSGKLQPTGHTANVPSPVCLKLVPVS